MKRKKRLLLSCKTCTILLNVATNLVRLRGKSNGLSILLMGRVKKVLSFALNHSHPLTFFSGKRKQPAKREMEFLELYMSKGMMARIFVGHQAQDFLKSCTFGGLECTMDDG